MEVTVKFYSYCRVLAGTDQCNMVLPEASTIHDLFEHLKCRFDNFDVPEKNIILRLNQEVVSFDRVLKNKDELVMLYLIGGG